MGQKWPDCDSEIKQFVNHGIRVFKVVIQTKLDAVFSHGSLAMESFYSPKSDIDLLIMVGTHLSLNEKIQIHQRLVKLSRSRPITGFLELSVVLSNKANHPKHPIPYELHFGQGIPEMIQNGNFDYDDSNKNDPDLAAHFTVAKKRGVSLFGPTTEQMLGDVDWEDYLESVVGDLELISADRYILNSPLY
tara:strand:+ start:335 stop:904 length:570 start_codon:yes stop_codon:yes gene_type:complete